MDISALVGASGMRLYGYDDHGGQFALFPAAEKSSSSEAESEEASSGDEDGSTRARCTAGSCFFGYVAAAIFCTAGPVSQNCASKCIFIPIV